MSNNKFESLLELLINEENDKAEALFHEIVVEKSRDIYENLADEEVTAEAMHDKKMKKEDEVTETESSEEEKVEETTEEAKDDKVEETSEESKDEQVDEVVELEDEAKESETTEEESIEEVGGDATDELVKDISADEEGAKEMDMDMDADKDMDGDMEKDGDAEDMEDRVVDLEDALDELKAEFEAMMGKKDGDDEEKDETVAPEVAPELTPEVEMEGKEAEAKETVKEYKNMAKADNADHADNKASPVKDAGNTLPKGGDNIAKGGAEEKGRPAPTAKSMNATTEPKMKEVKADTKDGSDKSAKSPVAKK